MSASRDSQSEGASNYRGPVHGRWAKLVRTILLLAAAAFLSKSVIGGWAQVREFQWQASPVHFLISASCLLTYFVLQGALWTWTVKRSGVDLSFVEGVRIYVSALLTRYVPGGVWPFAQVSLSARRMEASPALYTYLFSVNLVITVLAAAAVGLPVLLLLWQGSVQWAGLLAIFLVAGLLIAGPHLLKILLGFLSRFSMSALLLGTGPLPRPPLGRLSLGLLGTQVLAGIALAAFVGSQIDLSAPGVLYLVSCWCASWLSGFLVLPVPMGLGVREAVLTSLLSNLMPGSVAVVITLSYRLFTTLIDLLIMVVVGASYALDSREN